jgi:hypothetical protein
MRAVNKQNLQEIERQYNPEYDIPQGPPVTWAEWYLCQAVQELAEKVEALEGHQIPQEIITSPLLEKPVQRAIDTAVAEINKLYEAERMQWISYFLESLEAEEGAESLPEIREILRGRLVNGSW